MNGIHTERMKEAHWTNLPREDEYSTAQVSDITGWTNYKISLLARDGKITRTRKGFYTKESVDAYQADRAERLKIKPADWIARGNLT